MKQLSEADRRHVEAAEGWCDLHSFAEARAELEGVTPEGSEHPDVLEVRWQLCGSLGEWEEALDLANALARKLPGKPEGYLYTATSLRQLGRDNEALMILLQAIDRFPRDEVVLYNLACLCCLLDRLSEARAWLDMAIAMGGEEVRKRALDDPELNPLWTGE